MPILASIYAVFLVFVAVGSVRGTIRRKAPAWYIALDFVADLIALALFVSYWLPLSSRAPGPVAVVLFLFSLLWFLGWSPHHLAAFEERDFSPEMNRLYKRFVLTLGTVLSFPAYWFGGIAAFRSL